MGMKGWEVKVRLRVRLRIKVRVRCSVGIKNRTRSVGEESSISFEDDFMIRRCRRG
jgi:hypothetical protein